MLEISRKYTYLPEVVVSSAGSSTTRAARHKMEKKNRSRIYDLGVVPTRSNKKIKIYPWPKTLQKYTIQLSHVLYHFFDMNLITACTIFSCSVKFHVVCTCTFFGDIICLLTIRKMMKIVTLIDLHNNV